MHIIDDAAMSHLPQTMRQSSKFPPACHPRSEWPFYRLPLAAAVSPETETAEGAGRELWQVLQSMSEAE
jgi:hypothetical protein